MVPTYKDVAPYSPTSLNVRTMVSECSIFTSLLFCRNFLLILLSVLFMVCKLHMLSCNHWASMQILDLSSEARQYLSALGNWNKLGNSGRKLIKY